MPSGHTREQRYRSLHCYFWQQMEAVVNFMPWLLYSQGNSLHYPLNRRLRESQSQSMLWWHEASLTLGQNPTLIPHATIPYPRHHAHKALPAMEGIISPNCNTIRCQSEVHYINWRCYLLTLRLCQKNIWTSQIQRIDRKSALWWVSLHGAAIKARDINVSIATTLLPQTDTQSFSRQDSCSATQEIPYKLPLVPTPSYLYPIQSLAIYYQRIYLHIILVSMSVSPKSSLPFRFSDNFACIFQFSHMHYITCSTHITLWFFHSKDNDKEQDWTTLIKIIFKNLTTTKKKKKNTRTHSHY